MLGRAIFALDRSAYKVSGFHNSKSSITYATIFSPDLLEVLPRSYHRATTTDWGSLCCNRANSVYEEIEVKTKLSASDMSERAKMEALKEKEALEKRKKSLKKRKKLPKPLAKLARVEGASDMDDFVL